MVLRLYLLSGTCQVGYHLSKLFLELSRKPFGHTKRLRQRLAGFSNGSTIIIWLARLTSTRTLRLPLRHGWMGQQEKHWHGLKRVIHATTRILAAIRGHQTRIKDKREAAAGKVAAAIEHWAAARDVVRRGGRWYDPRFDNVALHNSGMETAAAIEDAVRLERTAGTQTAANRTANENAECPYPASSTGWYRSRAIAWAIVRSLTAFITGCIHYTKVGRMRSRPMTLGCCNTYITL